MASVAVESQPSVVTRVANLPLVSSTYDLVSSAYISTKDQYPYLKSLCEMAEKGVKTITSVAMSGALPIIQKLEPQIAIANTYACKGLDRIEEKLPILNQPTNQVVANAKGAVTGAKDAMTTTVTGAKDCVASTITEVVDKTKEAVTGSVEKTKSVVNGSINTVLGSRMMQLVSSGVEKAFTKSELLVDQYLPLTEEELEKEAKKVEGFDMVQKPSYYVRLGSLSTKLRSRAYQQALTRVKEVKQKSQETISQLHSRGCLCCLKYMMFLFNLIFWLCGCGLLGVGIWLSVSQGNFATFSPSFPSLSAANLVIAIGTIVMVTGFLGCLGAIKENRCLLLSFFIVLLIILLAELILIILFFVYMDKVNENARKDLKEGLLLYNSENNVGLKNAWNIIQAEMHCCGVTDYTDWYPVLGENTVPDRCCMENSQGCGRNSTTPLWKTGCYEKVKMWFDDNKHVLGTVGMCILIMQILGMAFSMTLFQHIHRTGKKYDA